eukprot:1166327_1
MGSSCSKESTSTDTCNCFNNNAIENVSVVRYVTADWIWSTNHDTALVQTLSNYSNQVPKEIMYLVKDHTFHESQPYPVMLPVLRREHCCPSPKQLLRKKLCPHWYSQSNFKTQSLVIALHVSDVTQTEQIFECVSTETLPSLQFQSKLFLDQYDEINRTMLLDQFPIRLKTISIHKDDMIDTNLRKYPAIHMIIVNKSDSLYTANKTCKALRNQSNSMNNCIMVRVSSNLKPQSTKCRSNSNAIDALAKVLNIPCLTISWNRSKTIVDLFRFAIKYYWFLSVSK